MKIYISADIEGITGVTSWDEANKIHGDYGHYRAQMTREVKAAAEAAIRGGAKSVLIKDAHASGRNMHGADFPTEVSLIKGWSGHPLCMIQELNSSFSAVVMIGYHSRAGSNGNPLSHTLSSSKFFEIKINDQPISEFSLHGYAAATFGVPVIFVSGDESLGIEVKHINENIGFASVMTGIGASTLSIHPDLAIRKISEGVEKAVNSDLKKCLLPLAKHFQLEVEFKDHMAAYKASFFPGAKAAGDRSIKFETTNFLDIMGVLNFL